jgi:hypothetical protein
VKKPDKDPRENYADLQHDRNGFGLLAHVPYLGVKDIMVWHHSAELMVPFKN